MMCVEPGEGGARVSLLVVPGASRDQIAGVHGADLRVRVAAPPEKGRANAAVVALLARALDVRRADVEIVSGHGSRHKAALVHGVTAEVVRDRLGI